MELSTRNETWQPLCDAKCDHRGAPSLTATQLVAETESTGLNPSQQRGAIAGSSPLVSDLTLTLDLIDDAILVLHEDGRIIYSNHAAAVLALPLKASAIYALHMLPPSEPWAACRQMLRQHMAQSGPVEREASDPGTDTYWSIRLSALAYLGVLPRRLVLVIRDISESVRIRERLQEREVMAATGALLAGAAHQAKNAIFGLSATLDAFEIRIKKDLPQDDYVDNLRQGIAHMQTLMRDLLDYGNPTTNELGPVSMAAVARQALAECRSLATCMGVTLALDASDDARILASPTSLVRALENVVENAIQHSPQQGTVKLRLSQTWVSDQRLLRCDVIDEGPGFPPEYLDRLFTPFFTLRPGGTGLGLTIAKKIVDDLGGTIRLSNGPSRGAQIAMFLPMSDDMGPERRNHLRECEHGGK